MPKNKPTKGLLKRIRVTKTGKIRMGRAGGRHLRSHKSGSLLASYRKKKYAHPSDVKRVQAMLFTRVVSAKKPAKDASESTD